MRRISVGDRLDRLEAMARFQPVAESEYDLDRLTDDEKRTLIALLEEMAQRNASNSSMPAPTQWSASEFEAAWSRFQSGAIRQQDMEPWTDCDLFAVYGTIVSQSQQREPEAREDARLS